LAEQLFKSIGKHFEGLEGLANIATLQHTRDAAQLCWQKCTIEYPDQISGFLGMAGLLFNCEQFDQAEDLLIHVTAVWPDSAAASTLLARCIGITKSKELANRYWKTLLKRDSTHRDIRLGYIRHLASLGNNSDVELFIERFADDRVAVEECFL